MKRTFIALCITCCCLSATGQFFSDKEKAAKDTKPALKASLPEAEQKAVYIEFCHAQEEAHDKAVKMYPVKIHHTPEQRESRIAKAEKTATVLMQPHKTEIAKKHRISEEYLAEIVKDGKEEQWPQQAAIPSEED